ncbi:MAG: response regulator transcription factor [Saprospiraceae bacterium]|nr:response regulator transcription factor [Saprospiraceae bacterium]
MNLSCMIVEDEPLARNLLEQYLSRIPALTLFKSIANPLEALDLLRDHEIDILFLDVQMPEITGISLLKILKKKPIIILTTAYSEYALEGYELDVTDYLLKPITFERFLKAIEKATQRIAFPKTEPSIQETEPEISFQNTSNFIFVKDGTKLVKVKLHEIMYVEGLKDYVILHTPQRKITTLQRLKALEELLPPTQFIRVHNSYIVAAEWIDTVDKEKIQIGKAFIPISDTYRKVFKAFIDKRHLG